MALGIEQSLFVDKIEKFKEWVAKSIWIFENSCELFFLLVKSRENHVILLVWDPFGDSLAIACESYLQRYYLETLPMDSREYSEF